MRYVTAYDASEIIPLIRGELEDSGRTQRMMAQHLGFSYKHMSEVMNGKCGTPLPTLFRMLEYVDLSIILSPAP